MAALDLDFDFQIIVAVEITAFDVTLSGFADVIVPHQASAADFVIHYKTAASDQEVVLEAEQIVGNVVRALTEAVGKVVLASVCVDAFDEAQLVKYWQSGVWVRR